VLKRLEEDHIQAILTRALEKWRGEEYSSLVDSAKDIDAIQHLAVYSDGDARTALNTLEIAVSLLPSKEDTLGIDTIKGSTFFFLLLLII
jgi:putative ATPase